MLRRFCQWMFLLVPFAVGADGLPDDPYVVVAGVHVERVVPDIVRLSLSMTEAGRDTAVAMTAVEARARRLIAAAKELGVAEPDIAAANLRVTPHYDWQNQAQVYVGVEVARDIEIVLRDIDKYDALLQAILDAKVGQINGAVLESSREEELRASALRGAVADAREHAKRLVADLPQTVGRVHSITSMAAEPVIKMAQLARVEMDTGTAFAPGVIEIRETVQVVFYLTD